MWVAGAYANKAFSCPISLLPEGDPVWSWIHAQENTSEAAVPTEPEAAQKVLGPSGAEGYVRNRQAMLS